MKIGTCIPGNSFIPDRTEEEKKLKLLTLIDGYNVSIENGFDFVESSIGFINSLSDGELVQAEKLVKDGKLRVEACNSFIPGELAVSGNIVDFLALEAHVEKAMNRMQILGGEIIVFGSGGARKIKDNSTHEKAVKQITEFLIMCGKKGEKYGITVVVEPLCLAECNIINSVAEGAEYVKAVSHPNIRLLADCYHMHKDNEPMQNITDFGEFLAHTHIAEPMKRNTPGCEGGEYIIEFINYLKKAGYNSRISVECGYPNFIADSRKAANFLKSVL